MAVPSFPIIQVTGPVHHYVRAAGGGATIWYLGTAEVQPIVQFRAHRKKVMNDIGGTELEVQRVSGGYSAGISVALNRFSQTALNAIVPFGSEPRFGRGHLVYGVDTFELWQVFENVTTGLYPNMPFGYYWPQVDFVTLEDMPGNQDRKVMCQLDATPQWTGQKNSAVVAPGERAFFLCSTLPAYFPAAVGVPQ